MRLYQPAPCLLPAGGLTDGSGGGGRTERKVKALILQLAPSQAITGWACPPKAPALVRLPSVWFWELFFLLASGVLEGGDGWPLLCNKFP